MLFIVFLLRWAGVYFHTVCPQRVGRRDRQELHAYTEDNTFGLGLAAV